MFHGLVVEMQVKKTKTKKKETKTVSNLQVVKETPDYEYNRVLISALGSRIFFCPKLKVLDGKMRLVIGKKYDVTEDLQPYLLKKYRSK